MKAVQDEDTLTDDGSAYSEIEVSVQPEPQDLEDFKKQFVVEYLNSSVDVKRQYEIWSLREPKYFGKVAEPLKGMRCLR